MRVGAVDGSLSVVMGAHQSFGMKPIHMFDTDNQKEQFLLDLTSKRKLARGSPSPSRTPDRTRSTSRVTPSSRLTARSS